MDPTRPRKNPYRRTMVQSTSLFNPGKPETSMPAREAPGAWNPGFVEPRPACSHTPRSKSARRREAKSKLGRKRSGARAASDGAGGAAQVSRSSQRKAELLQQARDACAEWCPEEAQPVPSNTEPRASAWCPDEFAKAASARRMMRGPVSVSTLQNARSDLGEDGAVADSDVESVSGEQDTDWPKEDAQMDADTEGSEHGDALPEPEPELATSAQTVRPPTAWQAVRTGSAVPRGASVIPR